MQSETSHNPGIPDERMGPPPPEPRPLLNPDGHEPLPALTVGPTARFCRRCGDAWQAHWLECPRCAVSDKRAEVLAALPPEREGPTVIAALTLYFALLGASTIGLLTAMGEAESLSVEFAVSIAHTTIVLGWCVYAWRDVLPALTPRVAPWWFLVAAGGAAITFAIASGVLELFYRFTEMPRSNYTPAYFNAGYGWGMIILMVCVQPGVVEELAFRGVVQSAVGRILAAREAIVVSAMLFMTLHLSPANFPHTFAIGLALGYMRHRTGSMLPGMLLHFAHNLLCVVTERPAT